MKTMNEVWSDISNDYYSVNNMHTDLRGKSMKEVWDIINNQNIECADDTYTIYRTRNICCIDIINCFGEQFYKKNI